MGYHPHAWKGAKGILLRKPNKLDYTLAKSYKVISLLNCLGKVTEKVATELLSDWCERENGLHEGQTGSRKHRSSIDAVARFVQHAQESWARGNKTGLLLMDVKGAFDHVSKNCLLQHMEMKDVEGNIISWVQSFLTDRRLQLVIDGHTGDTRPIQTGVPQGSPVSPILFAIYLSGVVRQ